MTENCYIHIPFCKQKCNYCAFVSYPCLDKMTGYAFCLLKEISDKYAGEALKTLYIGGGSPSLFPTDMLKKIINKFKFVTEPEITIEVNPDDVTDELIKKYSDLGINRISMGIQSLNNTILKNIGRRHDSATALNAVEIIKNAGITNINTDLIYGLPNQDIDGFISDITKLTELPITHISLYGLKIEEGTAFHKNMPANLPSDDHQADMYTAACEILPKKGFEQYEISNFAKKGMISRHNINYWNNNSYYGFGVSAHGYVEGFRYYNHSTLDEYFATPNISEYAHHVTEAEKLEEEIFLGLRKVKGININNINQKFSIDFLKQYNSIIKKYKGEYLILNNDNLYFTTKGFLLSNIILSEFI